MYLQALTRIRIQVFQGYRKSRISLGLSMAKPMDFQKHLDSGLLKGSKKLKPKDLKKYWMKYWLMDFDCLKRWPKYFWK